MMVGPRGLSDAERHVIASDPSYAAERAGHGIDPVNHPAHYGGADNPYEAIKVIEAWGLGFCLGNTVKYISRAGKKDALVQDLKKAAWYLQREISNLEQEKAEVERLTRQFRGEQSR